MDFRQPVGNEADFKEKFSLDKSLGSSPLSEEPWQSLGGGRDSDDTVTVGREVGGGGTWG